MSSALTTREAVIQAAAKVEITLMPYEITGREPGELYIDGMPADQWIEAMGME